MSESVFILHSKTVRKRWFDTFLKDPDFHYKHLTSEEFITLAESGEAKILGAKVVISDSLPCVEFTH